ncbi:MAG: TM1812 family CRISPR-associated protein [Thermoproteota archaeon]
MKIEELLKKEKDEKNVKLRKDINTSFESERLNFNQLINETRVAYNAIRYNVPLAYFDDDIISFKISEKDALSNLRNILKYIVEDKKELRKDKGEIVIKRPSVERVLFINLLLTTAFHRALREFKEGLKKESSTDVILKEFKSLYEKVGLGLNSRFLERDINEIKELFPYLGEKEETIKELKKRKLVPQLQNARENKNGKKGGDIKRNFFAHSGFEETITLIKKQNEKYCLCYKPEEKTNIKKWLENPENKKSEIKIFIAM